MVGILLSYWGGLFSGATLVSGRVVNFWGSTWTGALCLCRWCFQEGHFAFGSSKGSSEAEKFGRIGQHQKTGCYYKFISNSNGCSKYNISCNINMFETVQCFSLHLHSRKLAWNLKKWWLEECFPFGNGPFLGHVFLWGGGVCDCDCCRDRFCALCSDQSLLCLNKTGNHPATPDAWIPIFSQKGYVCKNLHLISHVDDSNYANHHMNPQKKTREAWPTVLRVRWLWLSEWKGLTWDHHLLHKNSSNLLWQCDNCGFHDQAP